MNTTNPLSPGNSAVSGVSIIKGEIHATVTLIRLNSRWATPPSSDEDSIVNGFIQTFRRLNEYLEGLFDLSEVDCLTYLAPFHQVIVSKKASGPLTSAALNSLSKFALYGFLHESYPRVQEGVALIANAISHCIFEETDWESDELILMKLLELSALCFRCDAFSLLTINSAWDIYSTCLSIRGHYKASKILKSEAETALVHLTLTSFARAGRHRLQTDSEHVSDININEPELTCGSREGVGLLLHKIMTVLSNMLEASQSIKNKSRGVKEGSEEMVRLSLFLINIALEAGGLALGQHQALVDTLRNEVCRHLLRVSQLDSLEVLGLALRVVFNLFVSIKDHMKVQLEVFLTSVHLRLLNKPNTNNNNNNINNPSGRTTFAREELALESMLEFCREPSVMLDLYTNYDCDVQCTNLFDAIINTLCSRAFNGPSSPFDILNSLAFDGVLAVLHSVSNKCSSSSSEVVVHSDVNTDLNSFANANLNVDDKKASSDSVDSNPSDLGQWVGESDPQPLFHYSGYQNDLPASPSVATNVGNRSCSSPTEMSRETSSITMVDGENEETTFVLQAKARDAEKLRNRKLMKQKLKLAAEKFNSKPLKMDWIRFAIDLGILKSKSERSSDNKEVIPADLLTAEDALSDAASVAAFLKYTPGLGKTQIGEYISKGPPDMYPFHARVLKEYVATFDFSGPNSHFDKALRMFLGHFRLPGEAQCIDRLMEAFAGKLFEYLGVNKPFASADAAFILSFSTIMLNTDLHNPQIPLNKKMTKEQFIRNNRGINDGKDLPIEYLDNLYDEIKSRQIQVDIDINDSTVTNYFVDYSDSVNWTKLISKSTEDQAPALFTPTIAARKASINGSSMMNNHNHNLSMLNERDMFLVMAQPVLETLLKLLEHSNDDNLLCRILQGLWDYSTVCVSLKLYNIFSSLVQILLYRCRDNIHKTRSVSIKLYTKSNVLASRIQYKQLQSDFGVDLFNLVNTDVNVLIESSKGAISISENGNPEEGRLNWSDSTLVKNELVIKVLFSMCRQDPSSLDESAWISILLFLVYARSRSALSNPLNIIGEDFRKSTDVLINESFKANIPSVSEAEDADECNSMFIESNPSIYAMECYLTSYGFNLNDENVKKNLKLFPPSTQTSTNKLSKGGGKGPSSSSVPNKQTDNSNNKSWMRSIGGLIWGGGGNSNDVSNNVANNSSSSSSSTCVVEETKKQPFEHFNNANASANINMETNQLFRPDDELLKSSLTSCRPEILLFKLDNNVDNNFFFSSEVTSRKINALISSLFEVLEAITLCKLDRTKMKQYDEDQQQHLSVDLQETSNKLSKDEESFVLSEILTSKPFPDSIIPEELDAVVVLEWLATIVFSSESNLRIYWPRINSFMKILLEDNIDIISIRCPYFLERCTVIIIKSTIKFIQYSSRQLLQKFENVSTSFDLIWVSLRLMRSMPSEIVCNISDQLGAGICSLIKVSHENSIFIHLDHWYMIFSILSAATSGVKGRPYVWQSVVYLMENNLINDMNYTPCRHLILRFFQNAFPGETTEEDNNNNRKLSYWLIPSVSYLTRLMLMALSGYSQKNSSSSSSDGITSPTTTTTTTPTTRGGGGGGGVPNKLLNKRGNMSIASYDDPKRLIGSPKYSQVRSNTTDPYQFHLQPNKKSVILNNIMTNHFPMANPVYLCRGLNNNNDNDIDVKISSQSQQHQHHISVSSILFANREEVELLWLETCKLLSDMRNTSNCLESSIKAIFCSEIVLDAGKTVEIPFNLQLKALNEVISRLPLSFQVLNSSKQPVIANPSNSMEFTYCCLYSCNVVFDIFVANISELRKSSSDFPVVFIRFIGTLATNMNLLHNNNSNKTSSSSFTNQQQHIFEEVFDMTESLIRLLRIPTISSHFIPSMNNKSDSSSSSSSSNATTVASSSYFGILNWIFQDELTDQPPLPTNPNPNNNMETKKITTAVVEEESPTPNKSVSVLTEDHDGNMLTLSWRTVNNIFPSFSNLLRGRNPTLHYEIVRFVDNMSLSPPVPVPPVPIVPPSPPNQTNVSNVQLQQSPIPTNVLKTNEITSTPPPHPPLPHPQSISTPTKTDLPIPIYFTPTPTPEPVRTPIIPITTPVSHPPPVVTTPFVSTPMKSPAQKMFRSPNIQVV